MQLILFFGSLAAFSAAVNGEVQVDESSITAAIAPRCSTPVVYTEGGIPLTAWENMLTPLKVCGKMTGVEACPDDLHESIVQAVSVGLILHSAETSIPPKHLPEKFVSFSNLTACREFSFCDLANALSEAGYIRSELKTIRASPTFTVRGYRQSSEAASSSIAVSIGGASIIVDSSDVATEEISIVGPLAVVFRPSVCKFKSLASCVFAIEGHSGVADFADVAKIVFPEDGVLPKCSYVAAADGEHLERQRRLKGRTENVAAADDYSVLMLKDTAEDRITKHENVKVEVGVTTTTTSSASRTDKIAHGANSAGFGSLQLGALHFLLPLVSLKAVL